MKLKLFFTVLGILLLSYSLTAKEIARSKQVDFKHGVYETSVVGIIKGYDTINYKLYAKKNQMLRVSLMDDNVYFNVLAPNKGSQDGALFMGKTDGKNFVRQLSKNGTYTIKVYLLHEYAKKDERILYSVDIGLE